MLHLCMSQGAVSENCPCAIVYRLHLEIKYKSQLHNIPVPILRLTPILSEVCSHTHGLLHIDLVWYFAAVDSSVHLRQTHVRPSVQTNQ